MPVPGYMVFLFAAVAVSVLLGHKQLVAFYKKALPCQKPQAKEKSGYGTLDQVPEPTPLMITPEQVKNYDDRPWRPFRWPYHQTMSIFKLDINHWLDMDKY